MCVQERVDEVEGEIHLPLDTYAAGFDAKTLPKNPERRFRIEGTTSKSKVFLTIFITYATLCVLEVEEGDLVKV